MLSDVEKQNIGFVCGNCKNRMVVNFEKMINGEVIKLIRQKEKLTSELKSQVLKLKPEKKD